MRLRRNGIAFQLGHRLLSHMSLLVAVVLDGEHDEHQRQDAEDERLDQVEHEFQASSRTGRITTVRAVMTPSATSPP